MGKVSDIDLGGAGYEYSVLDSNRPSGIVQVDIFSRNHGFYIEGIAARVAHDGLIAAPCFSKILTRRCGLEFLDLTRSQTKGLISLFARTQSRGGQPPSVTAKDDLSPEESDPVFQSMDEEI